MKVSNKKYGQIMDAVEDCLVKRNNGGVLVSEADFLAGAMKVLTEIGVDVSPYWVMMIMSGRSVVEDLKNKEAKDE